MPYPDTAEGFVIKDQKNWQGFEKQEFKLKPFEDRDVDIAIECCGVCGSDVHTINGGWGDCPLPICVGHEIVGKAIKVGKNVKTVKVGDRVGAGAQVGADLTCINCNTDNENYCPNQIGTYGAFYDDGTMSQGGFASHVRVHEYFVFQIPHAIESEVAAPMLCAGLTVYSPLVRLGAGPGKRVAIRGLGGLGHFAIQFAKALGAEVYVLSHTPNKEQDAKELGADHFVDTNRADWQVPYKFTFDFIINSADVINNFDLPAYFSTLKVHGKFHCVGLADHGLPKLSAFDFAGNGNYIGASHLGSRPEMIAMLDLVAMQYPKIKTWIHTVPIGAEGCAEAVQHLYKDEVRYRYVLTEYDKAFGKRT